MKKAPLSVARRYARALLDVALEKKVAEPIAAQLGQAAAQIEQLPDFRRTLLHPALPPETKKKVAAATWKGNDPLFLRFAGMLIDRGRAELLPAVHEAFVQLWNERRGIVAAEAVSAVDLAPAQQQALTAAAKKLAGREVTLTATVDPSLLGGVVLHMDGRTYDGSLRAQLRTLRGRLASGVTTSSSSSPRS